MKTYMITFCDGSVSYVEIMPSQYANFQAWCLMIGADWKEVR